MELGGIVDQLKHKSILITGSTGFLGKIFVEKVLRVQPEVEKLYLLIRAADAEEAMQRVQNEVIGNDLFNVLREKHGGEFDLFISEKVHPITGDIARESLGIDDDNLKEKLWKNVDIVVNIAATTNFFERYDVALGINVLGAKHVLEFGSKCTKLKMLLHVSTAYVAGIQAGLILEKLFPYGVALKEGDKLDIEVELRLVEETKRKVLYGVAMDAERKAMKDLGLQRAQNFGWPNTYVFTKAMAEMFLCHFGGNIPLVIIHPTIVTSIYKEPLPGWIEETRTIDSFIEPWAKGKLSCFFGDLSAILDVVIAATVASDPEKYNEAFLDKPNKEYCAWILDSEKWGGAIELSILSKYYGREIAAYDIQTMRCDLYSQDKNYQERVLLIYDGLHYDALALSPFEGAPEEFDQTIFAVNKDHNIGAVESLALNLVKDANRPRLIRSKLTKSTTISRKMDHWNSRRQSTTISRNRRQSS